MQTFLPYASFEESAKVLDDKRLGKQRVEAWQIILSLSLPSYGWKNHPAVKMWRGYVPALSEYGLAICDEWIRRGFRDTVRDRFITVKHTYSHMNTLYPRWLGQESFHSSHRAALLFKKVDHYGRFGWLENPAIPDPKGSLPYVWPVNG